MLRSLVSALPSLSKVLLAHNGEDNEDASLLATICDSAEHLVTFSSDVAEGCLAETLSLLESLLYDIPDETVPRLVLTTGAEKGADFSIRLALTPKQMNSLVALLSMSRPHGLMEVLSRVFMLLATCKAFFLPLILKLKSSRRWFHPPTTVSPGRTRQ